MRPNSLALALVMLPLLWTAACSAVPPSDAAEAGSAASPWSDATTIGRIVAERPATAQIFDLVGIDYCCGGGVSLRDAAAAGQLEVDHLLAALYAVGSSAAPGDGRDWTNAPVADLVDHIVTTHHAWLRRELPLVISTGKTVARVHGDAHPELSGVVTTLEKMRDAVLPHLEDEETRVFPAIVALEAGGTVDGAAEMLAALRADHDELGGWLHELRETTGGFVVPADGCAKYRQLMSGLVALERDLHTHVHLENNVLLPKGLGLLH